MPRTTTCLAAILGAVIVWATAAVAVEPPASAVNALQTVTAKRAAVADEVLAVQVVTALHEDPYFPDMHVTVTINNGVVHLTGFVL